MKEYLTIHNKDIEIPAILWGKPDKKVIIAVHGDQSGKEDAVIELLAANAIPENYCVLSFDLPEHGERRNEPYRCNPWNCISDLRAVYSRVQSPGTGISLFACSMGAYFGLLAFHDVAIRKSLFLSPVVNMERVIQDMMAWFGVSEERLKDERIITLPIGKTLDWDYYSYVRQHPVNFSWDSPVSILYGSEDQVSAREEIEKFRQKYDAELTVLEGAEHYFASGNQLHSFGNWLKENL